MNKIITQNIFPPIPIRVFDWIAYFEGENDGLRGFGRTESLAIQDLKEQVADIQEKEDNRCPIAHIKENEQFKMDNICVLCEQEWEKKIKKP